MLAAAQNYPIPRLVGRANEKGGRGELEVLVAKLESIAYVGERRHDLT